MGLLIWAQRPGNGWVIFFSPFSTERCSFLERVNTIGFLPFLWHSKVPWRAAHISVSERPCWSYRCNLLVGASPCSLTSAHLQGGCLLLLSCPEPYPPASDKLSLKCVKITASNEQSLGTHSCHQLSQASPPLSENRFLHRTRRKLVTLCGVR